MSESIFWPRAGLGNVMGSSGGIRVQWRSEFESGHPVIDAQHRALWSLANELADRVELGRPRTEIDPLVAEILEEIEAHFATEEDALQRAGYNGTAKHADLHQDLLSEARDLVASTRDGGEPSYFCDFLVFGLIVGHILGEDRKYFGRLNG